MGRSFLSIKLAAVFGLLVAAGVTLQEGVAAPQSPVEQAVVTQAVVHVHQADGCDSAAATHVRTARATARGARAADAARS